MIMRRILIVRMQQAQREKRKKERKISKLRLLYIKLHGQKSATIAHVVFFDFCWPEEDSLTACTSEL